MSALWPNRSINREPAGLSAGSMSTLQWSLAEALLALAVPLLGQILNAVNQRSGVWPRPSSAPSSTG